MLFKILKYVYIMAVFCCTDIHLFILQIIEWQ